VIEKCFAKIDEIEKKYRDFHDKNIILLKEHHYCINALYLSLRNTISEVFELGDVSKKKKIEDKKILKELLKKLKS